MDDDEPGKKALGIDVGAVTEDEEGTKELAGDLTSKPSEPGT